MSILCLILQPFQNELLLLQVIANSMSFGGLMDQELSITEGRGLGGFKACLVLKQVNQGFIVQQSIFPGHLTLWLLVSRFMKYHTQVYITIICNYIVTKL